MDAWSESFLWASMLWGGIAGGYMLYGKKQKAWVPFAGGAAMMGASFMLPALPMSLAGVAIMLLVWWMMKQDY